MVPSTGALSVRCPQRITKQPNFRCAEDSARYSRKPGKWLRCQNLALNGDLMFDQGDVPPRMKETLW